MTSKIATDIQHAYSALRTLVMQNPKPAFVNNSYRAFRAQVASEYYHNTSTTDPVLVHFAVISSHHEWEIIYQHPIPGTAECIGDFCGRLVTDGLAHFDLTMPELSALRREVLDADECYATYLKDVHALQKSQSYSSLPHLLGLRISYDRLAEARQLLDRMRQARSTEPYAEIDYPFFASRYYVACAPDCIQLSDLPAVLEAIEWFEDADKVNRVLGRFDPVGYMHKRAELIEMYLSTLQEQRATSEDRKTLAGMAERILGNPDIDLMLDRDFVGAASEDEKNLMISYDELLLELADYRPEEYMEPIFRGTATLLWRKRASRTYPGKLDDLLNSLPRKGSLHGLSMADLPMMERLIAEFPEREAEIREQLDPRSMNGGTK